MIAEVTTAALMSENKHLANPCSTDSTPTSANQEDHVSMAAHGARRLGRMTANLSVILGIEAICAAQGIEQRAPLVTSERLQAVLRILRAVVPRLGRIATSRRTSPRRRRASRMAALPTPQVGDVAMSLIEITPGRSPLVLGLPHTGTEMPDDCLSRLNETGARPCRYRLAHRPALRGLVEDVTTVRTPVPPLRDRRQPRPVGDKPLSRVRTPPGCAR